MSDNQLRQKIIETLYGEPANEEIWHYGSRAKYYEAMVWNDPRVDAILQAVIESLPEDATPDSPGAKAYNIALKEVNTILTDAMSTGGRDE